MRFDQNNTLGCNKRKYCNLHFSYKETEAWARVREAEREREGEREGERGNNMNFGGESP